ncbi:hypothetical protein BpOF4_19150 [Alkalihalophilus pseudofirmus OF4]|uniref:Uncharacterized protein n=1 Tax=Alkalihalophilus pseudofirmus (strain ATCC BAA-2126 / JCM 17055 / OF4) TaxID=398511 RepID=D3FT04_ALKPO|nr:hypothetical protein BpOF4_19150 [Alkalihalophilus pseudofirmus OF4]
MLENYNLYTDRINLLFQEKQKRGQMPSFYLLQ